VQVDHGLGVPGTGTFLLHQGIQRRIGMTVMHEKTGGAMLWHDVRELVAGRVRTAPQWRSADTDCAVLSLSLLPAHYLQHSDDDRSATFSDCIVVHSCYCWLTEEPQSMRVN